MKLFQNLFNSIESKFYEFHIPPLSSILYLGNNGEILKNLQPAVCIVVKDCKLESIEQQIFDYIILSPSALYNCDVQELLEKIKPFCDNKTTIFIRPNNFSKKQLINFLYLSDFESITSGRNWVIAKKLQAGLKQEFSVSVIIPCRNEKGNVEQAILRTPQMGSSMEFIFVEGHSKDDTLEEIKRVKEKYKEKDISYFIQDGKGKANAVFKGFDNAKGDILIILDADLTVPPEDLIKFYNAIASNKARFINGSRLVYPMEKGAMQFLNYIANHGFGFILSWIMGQKIKDSLCGTKVLFKKDYELMRQKSNFFFALDPFGDFCLLLGAAQLGLKIIDIPVFYKSRSYGSTQIRRFFHGVILTKIVIYAALIFKFGLQFNVLKAKNAKALDKSS